VVNPVAHLVIILLKNLRMWCALQLLRRVKPVVHVAICVLQSVKDVTRFKGEAIIAITFKIADGNSCASA
jgi:hypothetical protein